MPAPAASGEEPLPDEELGGLLKALDEREFREARIRLNAGIRLSGREAALLKRLHAASGADGASEETIMRICEEMDIWWVNGGGGTCFTRNGGESWLEVREHVAGLYMIERGLKNRRRRNSLSDLDRAFLHITRRRVLDRAIEALAGYRSGVHRVKNFRILVRRGPGLLKPVKGEFPFIETFLAGRLVREDGNRVQFDRFNLWMQRACQKVYGECQLNTQVLILAGPAGSAKSRLQHDLITPLLGGRSGDPSRYVFGETTFNEGWMGCEHLLIEDPRPSMKLHDRLQFAQILKSFTVNEEQSLHAKGKAEFGTKARFAVTISLNDDPDSLRILPPLTPDFRDKVMLFKVARRELPVPARTPAERAVFRAAIDAELPAYLWWLLHELKAPEGLSSERFGVLHYHDPELCASLWEDTPAGEMLALIDGTEVPDAVGGWGAGSLGFFRSQGTHSAAELLKEHPHAPAAVKTLLQTAAGTLRRVWAGSAVELQDVLEKCKHRGAAKKLIDHNAVSRMLARLGEDRPERVIQYRSRWQRLWLVVSPEPLPDSSGEDGPDF